MEIEGLNNREIAVGVWLIAAFLYLLTRCDIRRSFGRALRAALHWKLATMFGGFAAWVVGLVVLGRAIGIWDTSLIKDTMVWFVVAGLSLLAGFPKIGEPRFVRRRLIALIGIPTLIEFQVGIVSFPLVVELLLQPFIVLLVLLVTVAALDPEHRIVEIAGQRMLSVVGLAIIGLTTAQILTSLDQLDGMHLLLTFYLPIWLTGGSFPYVYAMGLISRAEQDRLRRGWREARERWD